MWSSFIFQLFLLVVIKQISTPSALGLQEYIVQGYTEKNQTHIQVLPEVENRHRAPLKLNTDWGPVLESKAAALADKETGKILWEKNGDEPLPPASLVKLMTSLVFLEHQPKEGMEHIHTLVPQENAVGGKSLALDSYEKIRTFDLLRAAMVGSENNMALALAHATEIPEKEFLQLMNQKAKDLGMEDSEFRDVVGLDPQSRSTAKDLTKLARDAFDREEIRLPTGMQEHLMETVERKTFKRVINTNKLLWDPEIRVTAGKTGTLDEIGYNLLVEAEVNGHPVVVALLGASSDEKRFEEVKTLLRWAEKNYTWKSS